MSFIDESCLGIIASESRNDELHPLGELIGGILEIIGDRCIHLHRCLDRAPIFRAIDNIGEPQGIIMDTEFLVSPIEELVTEDRSEVVDDCATIIEECRHIDCSLEVDIIGEISDFFSFIDDDRFITQYHRIFEYGIFFGSFGIRFFDPCLESTPSNTSQLFMQYSFQFLHFHIRDDMNLRIHSSSEVYFCLSIDLITIEFESRNREEGIHRDIPSNTSNLPTLISWISMKRDVHSTNLCDTIIRLGSRDTDPIITSKDESIIRDEPSIRLQCLISRELIIESDRSPCIRC